MSTEQMTQNEKRAAFDKAIDASKLGTLMPKGTLMMTVHVGRGGDETDKFELSTSMSGNPIVQHMGTGQFFVLSWQDIVQLAVARGITEPLG